MAKLMSASEKTRLAKAAAEAATVKRIEAGFKSALKGSTAIIAKAGDGAAALEMARDNVIKADVSAVGSAETYAQVLSTLFGMDWPTWTQDDVATAGENLKPLMVAYFEERATYCVRYKERFKGTSARPNPHTSLKRIQDYGMAALLRSKGIEPSKDKDQGAKRVPLEAVKLEVGKLYVRLNKANKGKPSPKELEVAKALRSALALIMNEAQLALLSEKF